MELLLENTALTWLCLVALFAFVELFFLRYRMVWLSVGCTAGLITALCSGALWLQIALSVLSSISLLWLSRGWVNVVRCDDAMHEIVSSQEGGDGAVENLKENSFPSSISENDSPVIVLSQPEKQEEFTSGTACPISLFEF